MRNSTQQVRETIVDIDDIKDQLNLVVHEIRSFATRMDEMTNYPLGLKYGFDSNFDYSTRIKELKGKTKGTKSPNKPIVLLVLMILECLKSGAKSERDIKDFVTEKCRKCGIKATNRGTIAGANLEISSACNILGALGVLEQSQVEERVELDLVISPNLPDPPTEETGVEDYLSFLAFRWSKTIESVAAETQSVEITSASSFPNEAKLELKFGGQPQQQHQGQHQHQNIQLFPTSDRTEDDMDFVDILLQSGEQMGLLPDNQLRVEGMQNSFAAQQSYGSGYQPQALHPTELPLAGSSYVQTAQLLGNQIPNEKNVLEFPIPKDSAETRDQPRTGSQLLRKSASSTKIWKIRPHLKRNKKQSEQLVADHESAEDGQKDDDITRFLYSVEKILNMWGEKAFTEHSTLEVEEKLLRRIAGQCCLSIRSKQNKGGNTGGASHVPVPPSHVGTRYLDPHYSNNNIDNILMTTSAPFVPSSSSKNKSSQNRRSGAQGSNSNANAVPPVSQPHDIGPSLNPPPMEIIVDDTPPATSFPREYESNDTMTSQLLIEKVRKSKRQRGRCLSNTSSAHSSSLGYSGGSLSAYTPNLFNSSYVNSLKNITQKNAESFWLFDSQDMNDSLLDGGSSKKSTKTSSTVPPSSNSSNTAIGSTTDPLCLAEFTRYAHLSNTVISNTYLNSSNFNPGNLLVGGSSPSLSLPMFKKYVAPLNIVDFHVKCDDSKSAPREHDRFKSSRKSNQNQQDSNPLIIAPIYYPDLIISTLEISWRSIVPEFQTIKSDESFLSTDANHTIQLSCDSLNPQLESQKVGKSRSHDKLLRSSSFDFGSNFPHRGNSKINSTIFKSRAITEVFAPSFRELPTQVSSINDEQESNHEEEDTADENYLGKHDQVLRNMREKWALMQKLKLEARREFIFTSGGGVPGNRKSNLQSPDKVGKISDFSFSMDAVENQQVDSLSPASLNPESMATISGPDDGQKNSLPSSILAFPNKKRSYSLLDINELNKLQNSSSDGNSGYLEQSAPVVKRRGRPPKIQKTSHLHYGKISN